MASLLAPFRARKTATATVRVNGRPVAANDTFTFRATSVIITAAYYLWAIHRMFLGKLNHKYKGLPDLAWRERLTLYPLAAICIVLGFYPQAVLSYINGTLHQLVQGIRPL